MATTKKQAAPAEGQLTYVVQSNLHHDGRKYAPGEKVFLEEPEAERLLELGVVQPAAAAAK